MIILVPTVSLSAVFPLCLVRLVGGEYSKAKNNNTSHQANLYPGYVAFEG